mmetsp:Transcript_20507/g.32023  ORF Transcript_20507/g.32023 Transcript_20507/m.32023 type:complete len:522 (-) Transcript_20507:40-1605(-)
MQHAETLPLSSKPVCAASPQSTSFLPDTPCLPEGSLVPCLPDTPCLPGSLVPGFPGISGQKTTTTTVSQTQKESGEILTTTTITTTVSVSDLKTQSSEEFHLQREKDGADRASSMTTVLSVSQTVSNFDAEISTSMNTTTVIVSNPPLPPTLTVAVIGAGNGGKAVAADLASQGKRVRLYQFPAYVKNITTLLQMPVPTLTVVGDYLSGRFVLDLVTTNMELAIKGADVIMVVCQALSHEQIAHELAGIINPNQLLVLNPGGGLGSLVMSRIIPRSRCPIIVDISELPYGCRATDDTVHIKIKIPQLYATLPSSACHQVHGVLNDMFVLNPALHVGEVMLRNGNPIIHPAILLLNVGRIERQDVEGPMLFYAQGVTPSVAKLIEAVDKEVMALGRAMGLPEESLVSDPDDCVSSGWAEIPSYYECYAFGSKFAVSYAPVTLDHRYLNEDCGMGLSMYCSIGKLLGVPTPACEVLVNLASLLSGKNFMSDPKHSRNLMTMGLSDLTIPAFLQLLKSGFSEDS